MHAVVLPKGFLDQLFAAIDAQDGAAFVSFLTEDAQFRFGSSPPVAGREAIRRAVDAFFDTIDGCSHSVSNVWKDSDSLVCEGEVCYRRKDDSEVVLPFVDVLECSAGLISSYRIYIDMAPLYAE